MMSSLMFSNVNVNVTKYHQNMSRRNVKNIKSISIRCVISSS